MLYVCQLPRAALIHIVKIAQDKLQEWEKRVKREDRAARASRGEAISSTTATSRSSQGHVIRGRRGNGTYAFAFGHPLRLSHKQAMRSKQYVPVPIPNPPRMPEFDTPPPFAQGVKKTAAKRAASYFMTLFCPWTYTSLPNLSYSSWAAFVTSLQSSGTALSLFRLAVMTRMSQGFAEDAKTAKLSSEYRQRNVRYWNSKTPDGTARPPGPHAPGTGDDEDDAALDSEAAAAIAELAREASRFDATAQDAAKLARAHKSSRTVNNVLQAYDSAVGVRVPVQDAPLAPAGDATAIYVAGVGNDWLVQDNDEPDEIRPLGFAEDGQPFEWPDGSHLSPSQRLASEAIRQYLPGTNAPPTPFLVCGGPGAGKTFVAR